MQSCASYGNAPPFFAFSPLGEYGCIIHFLLRPVRRNKFSAFKCCFYAVAILCCRTAMQHFLSCSQKHPEPGRTFVLSSSGCLFFAFLSYLYISNCNKHLISRKFIPVAGRSHLCLYRVGIIFETLPTAAFRENLKIFYLSERGEFHDKTSPGVPESDHQRQHHCSAQHQRSAR